MATLTKRIKELIAEQTKIADALDRRSANMAFGNEHIKGEVRGMRAVLTVLHDALNEQPMRINVTNLNGQCL